TATAALTPVLPTPIPTPTAALLGPCDASPGVLPVSADETTQGNTSSPQIALTFDAGASAVPTPTLLDILAKYHVHTTWFVTGVWANTYPDLLRRIRDEGHEIANHTIHHLDMTTLADADVCHELTGAEAIISGITGKTTRPYWRPPYGARDARVRQLAAGLGFRDIYWTIDTLDWQDSATTQSIRDRVLNNVGNGAIILMHAGSFVEADTLDGLLMTLEQRGYTTVTLTQVLG